MSRIRASISSSVVPAARAVLVATVALALLAAPVFAGKGGGAKPGGGSIALAMVDAADTVANHGDRVTFTYSTSNPYPVASLTCSQGGSVVYADSRPMYWPNAFDDPGIFTLASLAWTGGAADCRAELKGTSKGRVVTLASTTFHVEP